MEKYALTEHAWLREMYEIRHRWVPAYFQDVSMCCLMKTTSVCESSNASFKVNSTSANTLVQFMLCFETRLENQRYRQRVSDFKTSTSSYTPLSDLKIERDAFNIFTRSIFGDVQKEIKKSIMYCYVSNVTESGGLLVHTVTQLNKLNEVAGNYEVLCHRWSYTFDIHVFT